MGSVARLEQAQSRSGASSSVALWLVLGLLIERPSHGYELKQRYEERFFRWLPTSGSSIYNALDRLREEGLAESFEVELERAQRPRERMRHHHRATVAGVAAYRSWISELMTDGFERSELLGRIASSGMIALPELLAIVDRYAEECLQEIRALPIADLAGLPERSATELSEMLVLERQRRELQAQLDWSTWARRVLTKYAQGAGSARKGRARESALD